MHGCASEPRSVVRSGDALRKAAVERCREAGHASLPRAGARRIEVALRALQCRSHRQAVAVEIGE